MHTFFQNYLQRVSFFFFFSFLFFFSQNHEYNRYLKKKKKKPLVLSSPLSVPFVERTGGSSLFISFLSKVHPRYFILIYIHIYYTLYIIYIYIFTIYIIIYTFSACPLVLRGTNAREKNDAKRRKNKKKKKIIIHT